MGKFYSIQIRKLLKNRPFNNKLIIMRVGQPQHIEETTILLIYEEDR